MHLLSRLILIIVLVTSTAHSLGVGISYAQDQADNQANNQADIQEEHTLQKVDQLETLVEKIADVVDEKIVNPELLERFEEKKEEMEELLDETKDEIHEGGVADASQAQEIIQDLKKTVYLKTCSGLTDHDDIDDIVDVDGGAVAQQRAQETALDSMQSETTDGSDAYTVMLKTTLSQEDVEKKLSPFVDTTKQLHLEQLFEEDGVVFFELEIKQESLLGEELLGDVEEGDIPDHLLGIEVIKPTVLEIGTLTPTPLPTATLGEGLFVAGLDGEKNDDLRGMTQYESAAYQGGLHTRPKVSVAVIDTGIDYTHPDLKRNISTRIQGYDFVNKDTDPMDDHIHGTHVAGTIAASLNGVGVYGVNTNADLVGLKICTRHGYCPTYAIVNAIRYAVENNIDVLNLSLGGRGNVNNNPVCTAISHAVKQGSIVIAAAGNANRPVSQYIPGACPDAITVGAVDRNYTRARFSNYGPGVDVSAPGVGILSTVTGGGYKSLDGTSMATPHIAGLASAIRAYSPELTQPQMRNVLQKATRPPIYAPGKQIGGYVELGTVMDTLGVAKHSTVYTIPGTNTTPTQHTTPSSADTSSEDIRIQALAAPLTLSHTHITMTVGDKKTITATGNKGNITVKNTQGKILLSYGKNNEEITTIQSVGDIGTLDLFALEPGVTTLVFSDDRLMRQTVQVTVKPKTITLTPGAVGMISLPSRAAPSANYSTYFDSTREYGIQGKYSPNRFVIDARQLGSYDVALPVSVYASSHKQSGSYIVRINVVSPRTDTQSKKQQADTSFWLSQDYAKLSVGQKVTIRVDGAGPFSFRRKTGGIVGYTSTTGPSTTIASADSDSGTGDLVQIDSSLTGTLTQQEVDEIISLQTATFSGYQTSSSDTDDQLPDLSRTGTYLTINPEISVDHDISEVVFTGGADEIAVASAGSHTVTLVGLAPGDETIYVTDKETGMTKNIFVQVQETRLHINSSTHQGLQLSGDPTRHHLIAASPRGTANGLNAKTIYDKGHQSLLFTYKHNPYTGNFYARRHNPFVPHSTDVSVLMHNLFESTPRNRVYQHMKYTIDIGPKKQKPLPVKKLSTYPDTYFDIPDRFHASGKITMRVGQTQTIMVGSRGGTYRYGKTNHRIARIDTTRQGVGIASASDSIASASDSQDTEQTIEYIDESSDISIPTYDHSDYQPTPQERADIDTREEDTNQDLSVEPAPDASDEIGIASVEGRPTSFLALRPGTVQIRTTYPHRSRETLTITIKPKIVEKSYNDLFTFVSSKNLAIRHIRAKSGRPLSFAKKPHTRRKRRQRQVRASSILENDTLYIKARSRKEKRNVILQIETNVTTPELTTDVEKITLTVGETYTLPIYGGGGALSVRKSNHNIGFVASSAQGIGIASADIGSGDAIYTDVDIDISTGDIDDSDFDLLDTYIGDEEDISNLDNDTSPDPSLEERSMPEAGEEGLTIASAGEDRGNARKSITFQALRPNKTNLVVVDSTGQKKVIPITITPNVLTKNAGETLTLSSVRAMPIVYTKARRSGGTQTKLSVTKKPTNRKSGGKREIDTTNLKPNEILYARLYNRKERKYMRAEYHIHTTYNPLELGTETYRKKLSTIKVGEYYPLRINGGVPPYTITRASGTSATHLSHPVGKLEETDDLINIYGLKSGTTTFEVTDKKGSVETIDVTIVEYLRTLTIGDPLTFSGREGFTISSITSKSGRSLDIARAGYRWTIDTFDWRGGDTLYVTYESQVMGKRFETEVRVVEGGNNQVVGSNGTLSDFEERTLSVGEFDIVELPKSSNIEREYDNTKLFIKKVPGGKRRERIDSININSNENSVGILGGLSEWKIRDSIEIASAASLTDQYLIGIKDGKSSGQEVYKIYIKIDNKEVELVIHHSYDAARMPITPDYITVPYNNTDLAISGVWSEDRDIFDTKLIPDGKRNGIDDYILKFRGKNPGISYIHVELGGKDFNNYWDVKYADYRLEELVIPIEVYNKDYTDITEDFRDKLLMSAINMENLKSLEDGVFDIPRLTYLKGKKYLYYYNQVNTDKPWDYKNLAQIEGGYEGLPFVKIGTNNYSTEITGNFGVGYSASAGGIPLLIQYGCSYGAQYLLDRRYHTGNGDDEIPLYYETLINELGDRNQILRGHLLYRDHGVDLEGVEYRKYLETPIEDLMGGRINIQSSECNDIVFDLSV